jgi:drug/metabolite transporter (DMT)-like permease
MAFTFVLCAALISGNLVSIRFSNRELDPLWGAGLRIGVAALIFAAVMIIRRLRVPTGRALVGPLIIGVLDFAGGFALLYYALVSLPAGLAATLGAVLPLETLLLAVLWRQERLTGAAIIGGGPRRRRHCRHVRDFHQWFELYPIKVNHVLGGHKMPGAGPRRGTIEA